MISFPASLALPLLLGVFFTWVRGAPPLPAPLLKRGSTRLLQLSIILLGFRFPLGDLLAAGLESLLLTAISVTAVLAAGRLIRIALPIPLTQARLIASGTAICGGSAIAAVAPALRAPPQDIAASLGLVFGLNALALLLFPPLGQLLGLSDGQFATWAALAIHDTSSVVGAASQWSPTALDQATLLKLTRTLWILPLAVVFAQLAHQEKRALTESAQALPPFPFFILAFISTSLLSGFLPGSSLEWLRPNASALASWGFAISLGMIGLNVNREQFRQIGWKPLGFALVLWLLTLGASLAYVMLALN